MLDTFRKRDNLRAATPAQTGARASLAGAHLPSPAGGPARTDSVPVKPVLLDAPLSPIAAPALPAASTPAHASPSTETRTPASAAAHEPSPSSARLTVGPDIKLKGAEITDCDTLIVEGEVDASMDSRVVEIAEQGIFRGKVQVDVAEIRGRFEGELTAHKRLVIRESGRVAGKIRYGNICIDEGGEISGDIAATDPAPDAQQPSASAARALELRAASAALPGPHGGSR